MCVHDGRKRTKFGKTIVSRFAYRSIESYVFCDFFLISLSNIISAAKVMLSILIFKFYAFSIITRIEMLHF